MESKKSNRGLTILGIGCGCIFFIVLIIGGIYLYAGWIGFKEEPMYVEPLSIGTHLQDPYALTDQQVDKLMKYGYPEAFTILFYEEDLPGGGIQNVRLETWDYYSQASSLTFINGELYSEDELEISNTVDLIPLAYYPEQFGAFMTLDQVLSSAGISSFIQIPLEDVYMDEGVMYFAEGLSFGLKDNELIYVEALAVSH